MAGKAAVSDGCATSGKALVQWICAACTAVLPLWIVPCQALCWAHSCSHECRNVVRACGCQVGSLRWSWNKHKGRTAVDLCQSLASVW
eukprot:2845836-Rhodomonas_salina.1